MTCLQRGEGKSVKLALGMWSEGRRVLFVSSEMRACSGQLGTPLLQNPA